MSLFVALCASRRSMSLFVALCASRRSMSLFVASCSSLRPMACAMASACGRSMPVASRSCTVPRVSKVRLPMVRPLCNAGCRGSLRAGLRWLDRVGRRKVSRRWPRFRTPRSTAQTTQRRTLAYGPNVPVHVGAGLRMRPVSANGRPLGPSGAPPSPLDNLEGGPSGHDRSGCVTHAVHPARAARTAPPAPFEHLDFGILALPHRGHDRRRWTSAISPRR